MGLDMFMYKRKLGGIDKMLDVLEGESKDIEVGYWRKNFQLNSIMSICLCGVENCENYEINKELLIGIISALEEEYKDETEERSLDYQRKTILKQFNDFLTETKWDEEILVYSIWY